MFDRPAPNPDPLDAMIEGMSVGTRQRAAIRDPRALRRERVLRRRRRRTVLALLIVGVGIVAIAVSVGEQAVREPTADGSLLSLGNGHTLLVPADPGLSTLRRRIVALAEGQIGYTTDPSNTYCNKFSAYWVSGTSTCGNSNLDEEWCADFAAWAWQKAGAAVTYQYINGDLNSSSASFYEWGVAHGTWHPLGSSYMPQPGDVAVYGLNVGQLVASHVAIVVGFVPGDKGPIDVNGDGDLTAFSRVELRADEFYADASAKGAPLSGYVSPS
jgi:CHAP domain